MLTKPTCRRRRSRFAAKAVLQHFASPTKNAFHSSTTSISSPPSISRSTSATPVPNNATSALGHAFANPALLAQALTHRSAGQHNNERLEFLGDALVNLIVAELIYEQHPRADEGEMTRLRASLVNGTALAAIARSEELGERLHLGPGELKSGGFRRDSILADAFEAVVAALYLDAGWSSCRELVRALFEGRSAAGAGTAKDAKTRLQETL